MRVLVASGLIGVLVALSLCLVTGLAIKERCAAGGKTWDDGRPYKLFCYSDIVALYGDQQMSSDRMPYLERCPSRGPICDEYPVLTMYSMRAAAEPVDSERGFFHLNIALLAAAAVVTAVSLWRAVGSRALYFALAPTLALYGFINWDLLAVAAATLATSALLRKRRIASGAWIGVGAAAKLYPILLVIPFGLHRRMVAGLRSGVELMLAGATVWLGFNVPFIVTAFDGWATFFRFNAQRHSDLDSLWSVACRPLSAVPPGTAACSNDGLIDVMSFLAFAAAGILVYQLAARRNPSFERWTFGFPLLVVFLLTNKVYSPQYGLWLLPWFALLATPWRLFLAFEMAGIAVFVTRFSYLGTFRGLDGMNVGAFHLALLIRATVLLACLVWWVRSIPAAAPSTPPGPELAINCGSSSLERSEQVHLA